MEVVPSRSLTIASRPFLIRSFSRIQDEYEADEFPDFCQWSDRERRGLFERVWVYVWLTFRFLQVNDFDELYLRFAYVIGKDWEICSVSAAVS